MPPSVAASLPLHITEPGQPPVPAEPAEPEKTARCTFCNAVSYVSQMHDVPDRPRCADFRACAKRWAEGARPVSLVPHGAEVLEPLPEPDGTADVMQAWTPPAYAREAAGEHLAALREQDAAEQAATEALARWAPGEKLSKGELWLSPECLGDRCEDCPHALECVCVHHERDAARAADALAEHLGPDEQGFGEPEPAPAAAETEPEDGES